MSEFVTVSLSALLIGLFLVALRWPLRSLLIYLLLLLFHELAMRWARNLLGLQGIQLNLLSLWKDAVWLGIILGGAIRQARRDGWSGLRQRVRPVDIAFGATLLALIVAAFFSPSRIAGLAGLRDYAQPLVLFLAVRFLHPSRSDLKRWSRAWMILGALIATLAIWQTLGWNEASYVRYGFGVPSGQIGIPGREATFVSIRPPSTVTGSNELALQMVLLIAMALMLGLPERGQARYLPWLVIPLGITALVFTTSRSGLLGFAAAVAVLLLGEWGRRRGSAGKVQLSRWSLPLAVIALGAAVILLASTGLASYLVDTVANLGTDYHTVDTLEAIAELARRPLGVGMGMITPRQGFGFPAVGVYHVEGSLLQLGLEGSIFSLVLLIVFLGWALRIAWHNWRQAEEPMATALAAVACAGWSGSLVAFLFLPLMQAFPLMVWLWALLGWAVDMDTIERSWSPQTVS